MRTDAITTQPRNVVAAHARTGPWNRCPTRAAGPCGCGSRMVPDSVSSDDPSNSVRYAMSSMPACFPARPQG